MNKKVNRSKKLKKSRNMCKNNGYSHALHAKDKPKKAKPSLAAALSTKAVSIGAIGTPFRAWKSFLSGLTTKGVEK